MENNPLLTSCVDDVFLSELLLSLGDSEASGGNNNSILYRGSPCIAILTSSRLLILSKPSTSQKQKRLIDIDVEDIVGMHYLKAHQDGQYKAEVFWYPPLAKISGCCCNGSDKNKEVVRTRSVLVLLFKTGKDVVEQWRRGIAAASRGKPYLSALRQLMASSSGDLEQAKDVENLAIGALSSSPFPLISQRRYLVFVNPHSGKGGAKKLFESVVEPMLTEADIAVTLIVTERAMHAYEVVANKEDIVEQFAAVVVIGGDGLLFEVINGLASRQDGSEVLRRLPVAPIPGGSGNGLVKTILFEAGLAFSPLNATFLAIKGQPRAVDLSKVVSSSGKVHYSFLSLVWGIIAEIDLESEWLRCVGELRFHLAAAYYIVCNRMYKARLRMKLIPSCTYVSTPETAGVEVNRLEHGESIDADGWLTIEGESFGVIITQVSHLAATFYLAPGVRLDDGAFTIQLLGTLSRCESLSLLLEADVGGMPKNPKVRTFQCTEYFLEPEPGNGIYSLDGERVEQGPLHATMLPSAMRVLSTYQHS